MTPGQGSCTLPSMPNPTPRVGLEPDEAPRADLPTTPRLQPWVVPRGARGGGRAPSAPPPEPQPVDVPPSPPSPAFEAELGAAPDRAAILLEEGRARGKANEAAALRIVTEAVGSQPWVRLVRPAIPEEDRAGIDVVVETTDVGYLFVQVKSSVSGLREWTARYRDTPMFRRAIAMVFAPGHGSTTVGYVAGALATLHAACGRNAAPFGLDPGEWAELKATPAGGILHTINQNNHLSGDTAVAFVQNIVTIQRLAVERDRLKNERVAIAEESQGARSALRDLLQAMWPYRDEPAAAALFAQVATRNPVFVTEAWVWFERPTS